MKGELTQGEISKTGNFCFKAFQPLSRDEREAVLQKVEALSINESTTSEVEIQANQVALEAALTPDELRILNAIRARQMVRSEDTMNIDNFSFDTIDGLAPNMKRGSLGLVPAIAAPVRLPDGPDGDILALMAGRSPKKPSLRVAQKKQKSPSLHTRFSESRIIVGRDKQEFRVCKCSVDISLMYFSNAVGMSYYKKKKAT